MIGSNAIGEKAIGEGPSSTSFITLGGTLKKATGSIAIKNKDGVALAGTTKKVTGSIAIQNKDGVSLAGSLRKLTASVAVSNKDGVTIAATIAKVTASISLANKDGLALAGTLAKATGSFNLANKDALSIAGMLGAVTGSVDVSVTEQISIAGTLGLLSGSVTVATTNQVTVTASIGKLTADISVSNVEEVSLDGSFRSLTGSVGITVTSETVSASLSGLLGSVSAQVLMTEALQMDISGALGPLSGMVNLTGINLVRVGALFLPLSGAAEVANRMQLREAGRLSRIKGSIEMTVTTDLCYRTADDVRELILARLAEVYAGVVPTQRNDTILPEESLPRIILLDGDETEVDESQLPNGRRPSTITNVLTISPETYLTVEADSPEAAGAMLSQYERAIVAAVKGDAVLSGLVHNRSIRYVGNESAIASGRSIYGQMRLDFAFDYALRLEAPCDPPVADYEDGVGTREAILQSIISIAAQTEGVNSVARNDTSVPDDDSVLPRVLLLDGNEEGDSAGWYRGRPASGPQRMKMYPELYIVLKNGETNTGEELNRIRLMLLRGILTDPALAALAVDGEVQYEGCQTALAAGRSLTGEMGMIVSATRLT